MASGGGRGRLLGLLQLLHHTLNQFFRVAEVFHDDLDIQDGLSRPALALAIDPVLAYQRHRIGDRIHGDSEAASWNSHHGFVVFQFFLFLMKYGHGSIVRAGHAGVRRRSIGSAGGSSVSRAAARASGEAIDLLTPMPVRSLRNWSQRFRADDQDLDAAECRLVIVDCP